MKNLLFIILLTTISFSSKAQHAYYGLVVQGPKPTDILFGNQYSFKIPTPYGPGGGLGHFDFDELEVLNNYNCTLKVVSQTPTQIDFIINLDDLCEGFNGNINFNIIVNSASSGPLIIPVNYILDYTRRGSLGAKRVSCPPGTTNPLPPSEGRPVVIPGTSGSTRPGTNPNRPQPINP